MKRSGKFYRKNEEEVMLALGLKPTLNSGSGWIEKEDGQSEHLICQLKSTDAQSIRVSKKDMDTLNYNASVVNKLPIFAIQFLESNDVYIMVKPEQLEDVAKYLKLGSLNDNKIIDLDLSDAVDYKPSKIKTIKSNQNSREDFFKEKENMYKKEKKAK